MGIIGTVLLVAFVIVCVLLVFIVLIQNEEGEGMGGLFGSNTAAFGSHSTSVLAKTTFVLVTLFFVTSFALALVNKKPASQKDLSGAAVEQQGSSETQTESSGKWWENSSDTGNNGN